MLKICHNKCKKPRCQFKSGEGMENSASQTQYLGHVFIDVIFRFSPHNVHAGPSLVMPHVAAPKLTPDSTEGLFWLDSLQMPIPCRPSLLYDFPNRTNLVSFREAWHPCVNGGGGWDTWNPPSSMWAGVNVPSPTVCHIPGTFNLPFLSLFVCLTPRLACPFVTLQCRCRSRPLSPSQFLTNHIKSSNALLSLSLLHLHLIAWKSGSLFPWINHSTMQMVCEWKS